MFDEHTFLFSVQKIEISYKGTKSFACKTLARLRYCAAINSISAVCASSRSVFYATGNCITISYYRTKSFACKTLARPRYCAAINSVSAVCASSRNDYYVIGNCIAISYYIINKKDIED